jgi:hypothetical protein
MINDFPKLAYLPISCAIQEKPEEFYRMIENNMKNNEKSRYDQLFLEV